MLLLSCCVGASLPAQHDFVFLTASPNGNGGRILRPPAPHRAVRKQRETRRKPTMKAWKKVLALLLTLMLALALASCSTAGNKPVGNHSQDEDPSVAGNKPARDHSGDTATDPGQSENTPTLPDLVIDENAQPVELFGVQIPKYVNRSYTCQRRFKIVRKRRRNFVVFRRGGRGNKIKRFLVQKECSRFAASGA